MVTFNSIQELNSLCFQYEKPIHEISIEYEMYRGNLSRAEVIQEMEQKIEVMKQSLKDGLSDEKTLSGWVGNEAYVLEHHSIKGALCGSVISKAMVYSLAISGLNARRGIIVAAPTAGACGVLPGAVLAVTSEYSKSIDDVVKAMFTAGAVGVVIAQKASFSAAEAGCQAECGAASALAAAAVSYLMNGSNDAIFNSAALALKNSLGLSCDPIAGLVEVPCVKRNAFYAAHAIIAAEIALCGINSLISLDGVIAALKDTGDRMPRELKETSQGGLAITREGLEKRKELEVKGI